MKKKLLISILGSIFIILLISVWAVSPAQSKSVGVISYIEGDVSVTRNGVVFGPDKVDIGMKIENYDLIQTFDSSRAEVNVVTPSNSGTSVKIAENTAFYFDYGKVKGKDQTRFEMLSGKLSLKVQKLAGEGDVVVNTNTAVMGVRGTEFDVNFAPEGSILVTCKEGKVLCKSKEGGEVQAEQGKVVEQIQGRDIKGIPVNPEEIENYEKKWINLRTEVFKSNALNFTAFYVSRYEEYSAKFDAAYNELILHKKIFKNWENELNSGEFNLSNFMKDRVQVNPSLVKMRTILPMFEQTFFHVQTLKRFHDQGIGVGSITKKLSSNDFYKNFSKTSASYNEKLAITRYYLKLFTKRTENMQDSSGMNFSDESGLYDETFNKSPLESGPPSSNFNF